MKPIAGKEFCRILEKHGWELKRVRGSHHIYGQPANPTILTVPVHANKPLKIGTLRRLVRDAGLSEEDL